VHSVKRVMPFSCVCPVAEMHRFSWPMKQTRALEEALHVTVARSGTVCNVHSIY